MTVFETCWPGSQPRLPGSHLDGGFVLKKLRRKAVLTALVIAVTAVGCSKQQGAAGHGGPLGVPATLAKAEAQTVPQELRAIGNVEPFSTVQVKALVAGVKQWSPSIATD